MGEGNVAHPLQSISPQNDSERLKRNGCQDWIIPKIADVSFFQAFSDIQHKTTQKFGFQSFQSFSEMYFNIFEAPPKKYFALNANGHHNVLKSNHE